MNEPVKFNVAELQDELPISPVPVNVVPFCVSVAIKDPLTPWELFHVPCHMPERLIGAGGGAGGDDEIEIVTVLLCLPPMFATTFALMPLRTFDGITMLI